MDAPDTLFSMTWHPISGVGIPTFSMNVPGGALVTCGSGMTMVPGATVAHRWQRDGSEDYVEVALVPSADLGVVATYKAYINCVLALVPKHPEHEVWVSADDDDLPPLPGSHARRSGVEMIAEERQRQVDKLDPDHDREHHFGELAVRAAELAAYGTDETITMEVYRRDGWGLVAKHKDDRVRQLVIAGAMIAAEIDRLTAESEDAS